MGDYSQKEEEMLITRVLRHARQNVVAYLALFIALGGTSYAAFNLPANSVGAQQIKNHSSNRSSAHKLASRPECGVAVSRSSRWARRATTSAAL